MTALRLKILQLLIAPMAAAWVVAFALALLGDWIERRVRCYFNKEQGT